MSDDRNKSPDPKGISFMQMRQSETAGSHLAHWPPPHHGREAPVMLKIKHPQAEPPKRLKARGWRLTRAMFGEFGDDDA